MPRVCRGTGDELTERDSNKKPDIQKADIKTGDGPTCLTKAVRAKAR
jgi:hypothetical protein